MRCSYLRPAGALCLAVVALGFEPGCTSVARDARAVPAAAPSPVPCQTSGPSAYQPTSAEAERDEIFTLLAYSIAEKTWQRWDPNGQRGYNIAAVLVDDDGRIRCWGQNAVTKTKNGTQHAEVRTIEAFLRRTRASKIKGQVVYTTLEPCAMCSGMMVLQEAKRAIYGQSDPSFGRALERLALNTSSSGGYCPYPRAVQAIASPSPIRLDLEDGFRTSGVTSIVEWLGGDQAHEIYRKARARFDGLSVAHPENQTALESARRYLRDVPATYSTSDSQLCR